MKSSENIITWAKIGKILDFSFVGRENVGFSSGCHINFVNMFNGEEASYTVNNHKENGEGVKCFVGHKILNVFAFSEQCTYPDISVVSFPKFEVLYRFNDHQIHGYIKMFFNQFDLLITAGDLPNYSIALHSWITGEKVAEAENIIHNPNIVIKCSISKPELMAILAVGSNFITLWDIFNCCRQYYLKEKNIYSYSTRFYDISWTNDGSLFTVDMLGCVYMSNSQFQLEKIIDVTLPDLTQNISLTWSDGIVVYGPENSIRYYKKTGTWTLINKFEPENRLLKLIANQADSIVAVNENQEIVKCDIKNSTIKTLTTSNTLFINVAFINPAGDFIVVLCNNIKLVVFEVVTGKQISTFPTRKNAITLEGNPDFPYVAVGYKDGVLELISAINPEKLQLMTSFYLTKNPINHIYFCEYGRVFVAAHLDNGQFFILEGFPGCQINIITCIDTQLQILDYMLIASKICYRLFCLPVTSNSNLLSNKIIRYCIVGKKQVNVKEYYFEDKNAAYRKICATTRNNRDRVFYLLPFYSKTIHEVETKRGDSIAKIISETPSGHLLRHFDLLLTKYFAITTGYDGFVIIRSATFQENIAICMAHHRRLYGVQKANIDQLARYIIALGRDNVLVCVQLIHNKIDTQRKEKLYDLVNSTHFALMFKRRTTGFNPQGAIKGKCWLDAEAYIKFKDDESICKEERVDILTQFKLIKKKMKQLITANIKGPENEKLQLLEFNLDTRWYRKMNIQNENKCVKTKQYYERLIVEQDKMFEFIKNKYFDTADVVEAVIRGIFQNIEVANYAISRFNPQSETNTNLNEEYHRIIRNFFYSDNFFAWKNYPESVLRYLLKKSPALTESEDDFTLDESQEKEYSVETNMAYSGSTAVLFSEKKFSRSLQQQVTTPIQIYFEQIVIDNVIKLIKQEFNSLFEKLMEQKVREMNSIKDVHNRQRYIISEINYFSKDKINLPIIDPEWTLNEQPNLITKVLDHEISIRPYISPSEQNMLDAIAAEKERLRLLLLADDFKERALMAMMNGVLEIRWEDELKKDVPKPKCMFEKQPEQYNEEDLRTVMEYENAVLFLQSERERYKSLLSQEFQKNSNQVKDLMRKFNLKVETLEQMKLKMMSAIIQEQLTVNRYRLKEWTTLKDLHEETHATDENVWINKELDDMNQIVLQLQRNVAEFKIYVETSQFRDKVLEKNFKRDLQEYSTAVNEACVRIYRKRPKINLRTMNVKVIFELGKCVVSGQKTVILTSEAIEYFKSVDELDKFVDLPPIIDEHLFSIVCKHRRFKIENELKLKGYYMEISDGQSVVSLFTKRFAQMKDKYYKIGEYFSELKQNRLKSQLNSQLQLVIKRGFMELPLTGELCDFNEAICVPKDDIEKINNIIMKTGARKLHTINENMRFRRQIMEAEWIHLRKRMIINDVMEQIEDIKAVSLTKEIQAYLKKKKLGLPEKSQQYELEIEEIKTDYLNTINDNKKKINKTKKQINKILLNTKMLNEEIQNINFDISALNMDLKMDLGKIQKDIIGSKTDMYARRSNFIKQIEQNHGEILALQTELELLRLRTYPNFEYKIID